MNQPPPMLTVTEVAAKLRISKMTVYRLIDDRQLRAYRVSARGLRVDPRDLADYVRACNTLDGAA